MNTREFLLIQNYPMLKFIYIAFLTITSLMLFIFSKDKGTYTCTQEVTGIIKNISDSSVSPHFALETAQHQIYYPSTINENVVLVEGKKATICYAVDSITLKSAATGIIPITIHAINYSGQ